MTRRVLIGAAVAGFGLTACGASTARVPAAKTPRSCGPSSARTVAADRAARIYRIGQIVYGCSVRTGRRTRLGQTSITARSRSRLGLIRLAGQYTAFSASSFGVDSGSATVSVVRLGDGHRVTQAPAVDQGLVESVQAVTSLVVRADGAVAWIGEVRSIISHREQLEVHRVDARGAVRLDRRPGIAAGSLTLRGTTLSWRDDGRTRTSSLR